MLEAAEVIVDAIARSDGTRASVLHELSQTRESAGLLGDFSFDGNGDMDASRAPRSSKSPAAKARPASRRLTSGERRSTAPSVYQSASWPAANPYAKNSIQNEFRGVSLKPTRQQPMARNASSISARRSSRTRSRLKWWSQAKVRSTTQR